MAIFEAGKADGGLTWLEPDLLPSGVLPTTEPREIDTSALRLAGPAAEFVWFGGDAA
ncbi:hypothetical protein [Lentzea flaviverrucosa]|uniref:Uncharacterized protein n=1 Tax=Lentzea flaviverrucosa TaxID=200379 RepID=A0A1H9XNM3_9PSEU|nr:hypothetical protein [Lentzea flaviverrucosa]RDI19669.1 hypothetical protein DFR72_11623 [Lentzea flaviverrucosa]SES47768.1 hypothetical protein SAMN05216195_11623 [Lentzea flaviverrucosa]